MDKDAILGQLESAAKSIFDNLSLDNIFKSIGFDGNNPRLGWVIPPDFSDIEAELSECIELVSGKDKFIFAGMGGSINGIKTLISLSNSSNIYALDSLDPKAINEVLSSIGGLDKVLVCAVSKSGTTKETQLIAGSLRESLGSDYKKHFVWMSDKPSFEKLDSSGWQDAKKISIQVNGKDDIGGRFSSPHTMVFFFPLFLILRRDISKVRDLWEKYVSSRKEVIDKAYAYALKYKEINEGKFQVIIKDKVYEGIVNWVIQLFQESLGSKKDGFFVKALVTKPKTSLLGFKKIDAGIDTEDLYLYTMSCMHFLQMFTAFFSVFKGINFVSQPYVEIYKKELKKLEGKDIPSSETVSLKDLPAYIAKYLKPAYEFIDVILYSSENEVFINSLKSRLAKTFPDKKVSVFLGSDWNHHSYQAAFKDSKTLFVIAVRKNYERKSLFISPETAFRSSRMLQSISYATFKTLEDKAVYISF